MCRSPRRRASAGPSPQSQIEVVTSISKMPESLDLEQYAIESGRYESEGQVELVARFGSAAAEHLRKTPLAADQTLRELL